MTVSAKKTQRKRIPPGLALVRKEIPPPAKIFKSKKDDSRKRAKEKLQREMKESLRINLLSPAYALVTAIEGRALQSEGNKLVPWSDLQTELLERMPGKKCERRAKHQRRH